MVRNDEKNVQQKSQSEMLKHRHADHIRRQLVEMRRCLKESEKARDTFYEIRDAYKDERGLSGVELDLEMTINTDAKAAVANSQLFDRWVTKYAVVVSAEIAAFEADLHPKEYM